MAPKPDVVYSRGCSKSIAPSSRMVIGSNDDHVPEYVPPGTRTPTRASTTTQGTPKKVASGLVTASKFNEECILTGTPFGSSAYSEEVSVSKEASGSEEASSSHRDIAPPAPVHFASSIEADYSSTPD